MIHDSSRQRILIIASDSGPGIRDIRQAMRDGFSTSGSLGLGLPGVRRLVDEFEIASELGRGTIVTVKKWKQQTCRWGSMAWRSVLSPVRANRATSTWF